MFSDILNIFSALRLYQWIKNILLFVPLFAAHEYTNNQLILKLLIAFLSFSFCASSIYIINDLIDLDNDRKNPFKKKRVIASGKISIKFSLFLVSILLLSSFLTGALIDHQILIALIIYFIITNLYSFYLKKLFIIDCLVLSIFYTYRILIGSIVTNIELSYLLIYFSFSIFFSLALLKRFAELNYHKYKSNFSIAGRAYNTNDRATLMFLGLLFGYISTVILCLYIKFSAVIEFYSSYEYIWFIIFLLFFWINWIWYKAFKKQLNEDPIIFSFKNRISLFIIILIIILYYLSISI